MRTVPGWSMGLRLVGFLVLFIGLGAEVLPVSALAAGGSSGAIAQAYQTSSTDITTGTLVSLAAGGSNVVTPAQATGATSLVGVTTSKPLVQLSSPTTSSVQVVVSGVAQTLVSNLNGPVKTGDKITVSPVAGIGMKATAASEIVGTAQADLSKAHTVSETVKLAGNKTATMQVGLLPVAVNVSFYSSSSLVNVAASLVPPVFQNLVNALTGKQVSPLRALVGMLLLLAAFVLVTVMLITSIRSEIISLGRNPLASKVLLRGLIEVLAAALGILVIALAAAYAIVVAP